MAMSELSDTDIENRTEYGRVVGQRLRAIRRQKGLSLHDVEETSGQEFKASVLGAYERAERAISVPRLQRLASFYHVPVDQLLPPLEGSLSDGLPEPTERRVERERPITLDLVRLATLDDPQAHLLTRFVESIQVERQDFNGRMLTIRRDDLRAVACMLGTTVDGAARRLDELGLCLTP